MLLLSHRTSKATQLLARSLDTEQNKENDVISIKQILFKKQAHLTPKRPSKY
jgi:hypothetical protein